MRVIMSAIVQCDMAPPAVACIIAAEYRKQGWLARYSPTLETIEFD